MITTLRNALEDVAGLEAVRDPNPAVDRISGVVPTVVVEPASAERVAEVLAWATRERQTVVIRGAVTRMGLGRPPGDVDILLSMRGLGRLIAHEQGDLTATVEAGMSLGDLNEVLGRHRQCLPLDPAPGAEATIGGLLATNESGPLRHRHGTPRDLVLGIQVATPQGVVANAGGRVVKNVAGYDLSKLLTGSFGSLAAIVSATFKLAPVPRESSTVELRATDDHDLASLVQDVMMSQLDLAACEIAVTMPADASAAGERHLLLRCTSLSGPTSAQVAELLRVTGAGRRTSRVTGTDEERAVWGRHGAPPPVVPGRAPRPALLRASWMPADLEHALSCLRSATAGLEVRLVGRAAIGAGLITVHGDAATEGRAVRQLRESSVFANVVLIGGSSELKETVDVWGAPGSTDALLRSLKQTFDPGGILNAGRGPV